MPGLILFVHGLGGNGPATWGRFPRLAGVDRVLEGYDFGFYEYPTSLFRLPFSRKAPKITTLADGLRTLLEHRYPNHSPVVLICHSLGGLVARQYLLDECAAGRSLRVSKLMLYATPNVGAGLADVANFIGWRHAQLRGLCRESDLIDVINRNWLSLDVTSKVEVRYVIGALDRVVSESSARGFPGNPTADVIADAGHIQVVKPKDADDLRYLVFKNFVAHGLGASDFHSREPEPDFALKYYLYLSDAKVDMLEAQLARNRIGGDRFSRLRSVLSYLQKTGRIGTISEPREYFSGCTNLRWGPYADLMINENAGLVYFGGATDDTILGLGGSGHHVIGSLGQSSPHSHSAMPHMIAFLRKQLERSDAQADPLVLKNEANMLLAAVHLATTEMKGPTQKMEFVAKRLLHGNSPYPHRDAKSGISVLLGTPLYVAMAD